MSIEKELSLRSGSSCEICGSKEGLEVLNVEPNEGRTVHTSVHSCLFCKEQIEGSKPMNVDHWRCLNDSMWSEHPAVQVIAWRMLDRLKSEIWPQDLLDMLYLDEETSKWAHAGADPSSEGINHVDSNGVTLSAGDTVVLTQSLNVKGAGITAKRGTAVRNISLVSDNPEQIEGKVEGQQIVILTKFVKKSG